MYTHIYMCESMTRKRMMRGLPAGVVVKFTHSALAAQGSRVRIPGMDLHMVHKPCCGGITHTKQRKTVTDVSSGRIFLPTKKKL